MKDEIFFAIATLLLLLAQNSFFAYATQDGAVPNLAAVLFFSICFLSAKKSRIWFSASLIFAFCLAAVQSYDIYPALAGSLFLGWIGRKLAELLQKSGIAYALGFLVFYAFYFILTALPRCIPLQQAVGCFTGFFSEIAYSFFYAIIGYNLYKYGLGANIQA